MSDVVEQAGSWIYKMLFTLVVAAVIIGIVATTSDDQTNTIELQESLMVSRLLTSPDAFWYVEEETGVQRAGVVDYDRFDQAVVSDAFQYPDGYGGAKVELRAIGLAVPDKTVFVNQPSYELYQPGARNRIAGAGQTRTHTVLVIIKHAGGDAAGYLTIETAMPNKA